MKPLSRQFQTLFSWRAALAEFFAMTLFVIVGCGTAVLFSAPVGFDYTLTESAGFDFKFATTFGLSTAIAFGFAITFLAFAVGHISGGHINCCVSWAFFLCGKLSVVQLIANTVAQLAGSILGAAILSGMLPFASETTLGSNAIQPGVSVGQAILGEAVMTFVLVFTVLLTTSDGARSGVGPLAAIPIGLSVLASHLILLRIDGCSINPTRSFGPAVVSGTWSQFWVFVAGPYAGATLATLVYWILEGGSKQTKQEDKILASLAGVNVVAGPQSAQTLVEMDKLPGMHSREISSSTNNTSFAVDRTGENVVRMDKTKGQDSRASDDSAASDELSEVILSAAGAGYGQEVNQLPQAAMNAARSGYTQETNELSQAAMNAARSGYTQEVSKMSGAAMNSVRTGGITQETNQLSQAAMNAARSGYTQEVSKMSGAAMNAARTGYTQEVNKIADTAMNAARTGYTQEVNKIVDTAGAQLSNVSTELDGFLEAVSIQRGYSRSH